MRTFSGPEYEGALEVLNVFEQMAMADPRLPGTAHPDDARLRIFVTPRELTRLPQMRITYTIDQVEGAVTLWHVARRKAND